MRTSTTSHATLSKHTLAWRIGTGLPHTVPPGTYEVTGLHSSQGKTFLELDHRTRIEMQAVGEFITGRE